MRHKIRESKIERKKKRTRQKETVSRNGSEALRTFSEHGDASNAMGTYKNTHTELTTESDCTAIHNVSKKTPAC